MNTWHIKHNVHTTSCGFYAKILQSHTGTLRGFESPLGRRRRVSTMTDHHEDPNKPQNLPPSSSSSSDRNPSNVHASNDASFSGQKVRYPNPRETTNPDPVTLREQWKFAIRQYSKWYSHAWGTAILAGLSFFALGWFIKGSNPLPSFNDKPPEPSPSSSSSSSSNNDAKEARR